MRFGLDKQAGGQWHRTWPVLAAFGLWGFCVFVVLGGAPAFAQAADASPTPPPGAANRPQGPLYRQHPPEMVIVGDVDGRHILTRRALDQRVRMLVPEPRANMDAFETEQYARLLSRTEGETLEEWAILKTLVRLAEIEGLQVSNAEVDEAMKKLMSGEGLPGYEGGAFSSSSGRQALGVSEEELRSQVADSILIDHYLLRTIEQDFSDEKLKALYESSRAQFIEPPAYQVRAIFRRIDPTMSTPEKRDIRGEFYRLRRSAAARDGRDFEKYAREESDYPNARENAGDMGWVDFSLPMDEKLARAIQTLKIGEVSRIIETEAGLYVIRVEEHRPARGLEWDDYARSRVKDRIMFDLRNRMGSALLRAVPFPVRLNTSGLRLTTDPVPTPRPRPPASERVLAPPLDDEEEAPERRPRRTSPPRRAPSRR